MLSSYPFIDANTEGYEGDDENIYGEEEEHFDQYTNQGKLILLQAIPARYYHEQAILVQDAIATLFI